MRVHRWLEQIRTKREGVALLLSLVVAWGAAGVLGSYFGSGGLAEVYAVVNGAVPIPGGCHVISVGPSYQCSSRKCRDATVQYMWDGVNVTATLNSALNCGSTNSHDCHGAETVGSDIQCSLYEGELYTSDGLDSLDDVPVAVTLVAAGLAALALLCLFLNMVTWALLPWRRFEAMQMSSTRYPDMPILDKQVLGAVAGGVQRPKVVCVKVDLAEKSGALSPVRGYWAHALPDHRKTDEWLALLHVLDTQEGSQVLISPTAGLDRNPRSSMSPAESVLAVSPAGVSASVFDSDVEFGKSEELLWFATVTKNPFRVGRAFALVFGWILPALAIVPTLVQLAGVAVPYDVPAFSCTVTLVLGFSVSMFFTTYRGVPLAYTAVYAITNARVLAMIETSPVTPWPLSKCNFFVRRVVTEHSFVALAEEWRAAKADGRLPKPHGEDCCDMCAGCSPPHLQRGFDVAFSKSGDAVRHVRVNQRHGMVLFTQSWAKRESPEGEVSFEMHSSGMFGLQPHEALTAGKLIREHLSPLKHRNSAFMPAKTRQKLKEQLEAHTRRAVQLSSQPQRKSLTPLASQPPSRPPSEQAAPAPLQAHPAQELVLEEQLQPAPDDAKPGEHPKPQSQRHPHQPHPQTPQGAPKVPHVRLDQAQA